MSESVAYQKELDYSQKVVSGSNYKFTKILPQQGGGDITVQANNSVEIMFDVPVQCFNLSKSTIDFDLTFAAVANQMTAIHMGIPPIRRLSLYTRGGVYLCDLQNFQQYWKMTKNLINKTEAFNCLPTAGFGGTADAAKLKGLSIFNNPSNTLRAQAVTDSADNGTKITDAIASDNASFRRNFQTELSYISTIANTAIALTCQLRLGKIPFSLFSVNRNFYASEALVLRAEIESHSNFCFQHDTNVATFQNVAAFTGVVTMQKLCLYLAVENNEAVRSSIIQKANSSGLSFTIPYSQLFRQDLLNGTSASVNLKINRGMGQRLLRVISAESSTTDTLASRCNFNNYDGSKVQSFYTTIDSVRQQAENLESKKGTDYKYNQKYIKDTPLEVMPEYYTECPSHIDDFSGCGSLTNAPEHDLMVTGLDLSAELLWGKVIDTKVAAAHTENMIVVCQKTISSSPQGIVVM